MVNIAVYSLFVVNQFVLDESDLLIILEDICLIPKYIKENLQIIVKNMEAHLEKLLLHLSKSDLKLKTCAHVDNYLTIYSPVGTGLFLWLIHVSVFNSWFK